MAAVMAGALVATGIAVAPAFGAAERAQTVRRIPASPLRFSGAFTPAAADPRLAAMMARTGLDDTAFRFTPAEATQDKRAVTVAVRARTNRAALAANDIVRTGPAKPTALGIQPIAYTLGASVAWKRFALSGDVSHVDLGLQPGSRETADVALTYKAGRASSRLTATTDRPLADSNKLVEEAPSYSLDLSSSYSLTRHIDLTAGMRYRSDRERLARLGDDDRRDSQSVYVGTAFRF
jgi:hypothetical protein